VARGLKRVNDLKERGFANAGLYDPQGVKGTHVMYVLQHADKPELYSGLPADPKVSPLVRLWKGVTKPLLSIGLGLAVLGAFFHYITRGPKEVETGDKA
ncbi:MAG: formate dehydrogenase subunit beta, partial [Burkholderiaceae bacterium]|nr:formate dehydrogenase subunit beta [Burkholderiaceae bacterium]